MGVGEWFQDLATNLVVRATGDISYRYRRITKALNIDFRGTDSESSNSFYAGSYGRGTAIEGFSDLDMIYQLPAHLYAQYNAHIGNGQAALLQAVRASIRNTYPSTDVGADGQVVVVPFTDGITFEVVPAFLNSDGSYTFPNSNDGGSWKATNPKPEIAAIETRNSLTNGNLVHLCRMARAWKGRWAVDIGGLLIDTLAYQFIETWPSRDKSFLYHDWMARDFFEFAANQPSAQSVWRAPGSAQYVYGGGFQYKALRCFNISRDAIAYASKNQEWSAKHTWREIFGTFFPE